MNNNTRKIVVLDKLDSSRIEQAIFILRDATDICESDAVSEAQRIVNSYLDSLSQPLICSKKEKIKFGPKFFFMMTLYTAMTVLVTTCFLNIFH